MTTNPIRTLPDDLTTEEKLKLAETIAQMNIRIKELLNQKADLPNKIKTMQSEAAELSKEFQEGKTYREVECYYVMDDPEPGLKTLYRKDTDEIIETTPIELFDGSNGKAMDEEHIDIPDDVEEEAE